MAWKPMILPAGGTRFAIRPAIRPAIRIPARLLVVTRAIHNVLTAMITTPAQRTVAAAEHALSLAFIPYALSTKGLWIETVDASAIVFSMYPR